METTRYTVEVACLQDLVCIQATTLELPVYSGVSTSVSVTAKGTSSTTLSWDTPLLPASLDTGSVPELSIYPGLFGGVNGMIDDAFSTGTPSPVSCLEKRTGEPVGGQNLFNDPDTPAAGIGFYYIVGIYTRHGLMLGENSGGTQRITDVFCP